jgi:acyl-CoA dehydrogenase
MSDTATHLRPDTSSPTAFTESAHRFLAAHAEPARTQAAAWGTGSDRVSYFASGTAEQEHEAVLAARQWQRVRYDQGWGWLTGPRAYGGQELSVQYQLLYQRAEAQYDVPDTSQLSVVGLGMVGPTVLAHGQAGLKDALLPRMYSGESIACQLFSEPAAGSDLAGVQSRAVRDGDSWILNGQKVWTSAAQHSDVGEVLCRTNPEAAKHKGLTAFMVDMRAPGVEIRPLRQMTGGCEFNEVFLTDVRVPDAHRLGDVDAGWRVALTTLTAERDVVAGVDSPEVARALTAEHLSALMRATYTWDDRALRRQLAALLAESMAAESLNAMAARKMEAGATAGPERSVAKLIHARNITRASHFVAEVLGPRIIADTGQWGTFAWSDLLLASPALRILGGTEEIMKNILGEQVLGLPKEPPVTTNGTPSSAATVKGA